MKEKNIAIVLGSLRMGGAERVMVRLANGFVANGKSCSIIVLDDNGPLKSEINPGVNLVSLNVTRARNGIFAFRNFLRNNDVDALIISQTHIEIMCLLAVRWEGWKGKLILNEHSLFSFNNKSELNKSLAKYLFRRADAVVGVSQAVADDFKNNFHLNANLSVIHNASFDSHILDLKEQEPDFDFSMPVVLYVGRLDANKNIKLLIDAFEMLVKKKPSKMLLLGDGEIRNDLMQYAISKKIAEHVIFKGTVSNPYSYMKRSSVFVQTSSFEGLPTVLIEALACCCNIVCAESRGGAGEVLTDKVYGRIVPPDAQLLADAIIDSFGDKNNCDEKLKRAKDFGVEKAVEKYLELIGRLQ